uniref:NHL repeat containing 3 n=1 Tax=Paramormyrops kingsleyae TaxID=1676925 RepID=A0A3B3R8Y6_9TELE
MKRKGNSCLIAVAMGVVFLVMVVFYGTISPQPSAAAPNTDYRLLGKPLYKLDISWPKYTEHFTGEVFGVAVNQVAGLVYVAQRGENVPKVLVFSMDGDFLQTWNTSTLEMPHGIFLSNASSNPTVWITDVGNGPFGHTIKQYSPSGKLLQVLGTAGEAGSSVSPLQFDQPAEIFVHSSGDIYIVDGDGGLNNRLIKLSKDLQVQWMHGEKGAGLGQFYIPHSVTVDSYQRAHARSEVLCGRAAEHQSDFASGGTAGGRDWSVPGGQRHPAGRGHQTPPGGPGSEDGGPVCGRDRGPAGTEVHPLHLGGWLPVGGQGLCGCHTPLLEEKKLFM